MNPIDRPSPNHNERPAERGGKVELLVLHYTGMQSAEAALGRLTDAQAKVSAHYLIDEVGQVYRLVDETRRAWHAGHGFWRGIPDINGASIGIELANPGHEWGYRAFPDAQMAALGELAEAIIARHNIAARNVVGHSDVATERKEDPGELFDWASLATRGIGLFPPDGGNVDSGRIAPGSTGAGIAALQRDLITYGYGCAETGLYDMKSFATVTAFQRHFRPARVDGVWDDGCRHVLDWLLAQID